MAFNKRSLHCHLVNCESARPKVRIRNACGLRSRIFFFYSCFALCHSRHLRGISHLHVGIAAIMDASMATVDAGSNDGSEQVVSGAGAAGAGAAASALPGDSTADDPFALVPDLGDDDEAACCDKCLEVIKVVRFHCETCSNVDYCSECIGAPLASCTDHTLTPLPVLAASAPGRFDDVDGSDDEGAGEVDGGHELYLCDKCMVTIVHQRFHCVECGEVDYCGTCSEDPLDECKGHTLEKVAITYTSPDHLRSAENLASTQMEDLAAGFGGLAFADAEEGPADQ